MDKRELEHNIRICACDLGIDEKYIRSIPKNELIIDKEYFGNCRNSDKAIWKGDWKCLNCLNINFGFRRSCNRC